MKNEMNENLTLKSILNNMLNAYMQRDKQLGFMEWFADKLKDEISVISPEESKILADNIMQGVADYEAALNDLNESIAMGEGKEEWLVRQLEDAYSDLPFDAVGERICLAETVFAENNMQLMKETEIEEINDVEPMEWNGYRIKDKCNKIAEQAAMLGMIAAKNALEEVTVDGDNTEIAANLGKAFQENLKGEVKVVVAGAAKVAAEKGLNNLLPDTPTEIICDMAGVAVEGAEALFDAANGEIAMVDAMDKVGRAGVAAGCRAAKIVLKDAMVKVPVIGPLLVDLFGGLFEHMESSKFYENVYTVVRDATVAAWEGMKKTVKNKVNAVKKMLQW